VAALRGQALLFGSLGLVLYAVIALAAVVAFVKGHEEPTLTSGLQRAVPRLPAQRPGPVAAAHAVAGVAAAAGLNGLAGDGGWSGYRCHRCAHAADTSQ
jgi:type IV secretory pathway VirB2 component (pilin)